MRGSDCLNDLVTRARRYRLSQAEQARLDEHLSVCATCRLAQQIGLDFDAIARLRPGDDRLLADLTNRAVGRLNRGVTIRRRPRSLSMAVAVACILFSAAAAAGALWHSQTPTRAVVRSESPAPDAKAAPRPPTASPPTEVADLSLPAPAASPGPSRSRTLRSARVAVSPPAPPSAEAAGASASSLFANANQERRQAHAAAAVALYQELQRRHPGSQEALVSHVSLGRLLLDRGGWPEALLQLDQYLTTSPDGLLAPEALFGKAQALQALGRHDEERAAWSALLARFADSVYAAQARRRLEELR